MAQPPAPGSPELNEAHLRRLQTLLEQDFEFQLFALFPGYMGVKKYHCAALLRPEPGGRLAIAASPGYLVEGNISVKVEQGGEEWFVWKTHRVQATPERSEDLKRFEEELRRLLNS